MTVRVSIVLYETDQTQLLRCLDSVLPSALVRAVDLVDNSPTARLQACFRPDPRLHYFHTGANLGYGRGHNLSLRRSLADGCAFHLVLNADVRFEPGVIADMVAFMQNNPQVGLMMPKVLYPNGELQYLCKLCPSPLDLLLRRLSPPIPPVWFGERFELRWTGYNKPMFAPYLSGCFMLLAMPAVAQTGLFDERFFMYPEDIDYTRRMAEHHETLFFPLCEVRHEYGAASRKSLKMLFVHARELVKYFNKWGWFFDRKRRALNRRALLQFAPGEDR